MEDIIELLSYNNIEDNVLNIWSKLDLPEAYFFTWTDSDISCDTTKPTKWNVRPSKTKISLGSLQIW